MKRVGGKLLYYVAPDLLIKILHHGAGEEASAVPSNEYQGPENKTMILSREVRKSGEKYLEFPFLNTIRNICRHTLAEVRAKKMPPHPCRHNSNLLDSEI